MARCGREGRDQSPEGQRMASETGCGEGQLAEQLLKVDNALNRTSGEGKSIFSLSQSTEANEARGRRHLIPKLVSCESAWGLFIQK